MARMVVIYRRPEDVAAFEKHYFEVHIPLAKQLPGLRSYEVSRGPVVALAGASRDTFLVGTLHFDDLASIQAAFASELGKACAADRKVLAPRDEDVQMFLFDDRAV